MAWAGKLKSIRRQREVQFGQSAIPCRPDAMPAGHPARTRAGMAGRDKLASARLKAATPALISGGFTAPKPRTSPLAGVGVIEKRAIGETMMP